MKKLIRSFLVLSMAVLAHLMGAGSAQAAILTSDFENQLEIWLGEGNQDFTSLFVKSAYDGQSSFDFHAAVDGQGRTFSLMTVRDTDSGNEYVIGGYNPQSWQSHGSYNFTPADSKRTAFIYNLTTTTLQRQRLSTDPDSTGYSYGAVQTFNYEGFGPTFGKGYDLHVDSTLTNAYANNYSYIFGNTDIATQSIVGENSFDPFTVIDLEVYRISPAVAAVPEPMSLTIWGLGALGCAIAAYRRRKPAA